MSDPEECAVGDTTLTPEREDALLAAMLRHQVGIDPDLAGPVLDLAAVGLVNSAWRNSPVEDWHAGDGLLDDGAMLRITTYTTWRVRRIMRGWRTEVGVAADAEACTLDAASVDDVDRLAVRIFRWLTRPGRELPIGATLQEVAADGLAEYVDHARGALSSFAASAEALGLRQALMRVAAHGGLACRHWWGTPGWPALVTRFIDALEDPNDPHWGPDGERWSALSPAPAQAVDHVELHQTLLQQPWTLEADAAAWAIRAGIGYVQSPIPKLPDDLHLPE